MHSARLLTHAWIGLVQGLPEAKGAVTNSQLGTLFQTTAFQVLQDLRPALIALSEAVFDGYEFFGFLRGGTDDDQHTFMGIVASDVEIIAIGPPIDVGFIGKFSTVPCFVFFAPFFS